jgi:hypothetical protein
VENRFQSLPFKCNLQRYMTEQNMMQYLGIIEQRTNEILQMYAVGGCTNTLTPPPLTHSCP